MPTFVGLDVHLRTCHATVMNEQDEKFLNERREFERIFKDIDDAKVAMEACYYWQPHFGHL